MGETPGYISNPEAKAHSADGTALVRVWESRSQPDIFLGVHRVVGPPFFCVCVGVVGVLFPGRHPTPGRHPVHGLTRPVAGWR